MDGNMLIAFLFVLSVAILWLPQGQFWRHPNSWFGHVPI